MLLRYLSNTIAFRVRQLARRHAHGRSTGTYDEATVALLGLGIEATHKRYQRALARLRALLPESVFDEIAD